MNKIKIYGKTYTLSEVENLSDKGRYYSGLSCFDEKWLKLRANQDATVKHRTLVHEIAHMAMEECGMGHFFTPEQKEVICDFCSSVYEITQSNKEAFK